jgi:CBS domain-containing protein
MFIERLLPLARKRLMRVMEDAPLSQAAGLLATQTDLVIVRDAAGRLTGVITRTDIVRHVAEHGTAGAEAVASVMTRDVVLCQSHDTVGSVWERMKQRQLKNIPVVEAERHPVGVLHARDLLQVLLEDSEEEESMLRDYVMGVGYR